MFNSKYFVMCEPHFVSTLKLTANILLLNCPVRLGISPKLSVSYSLIPSNIFFPFCHTKYNYFLLFYICF